MAAGTRAVAQLKQVVTTLKMTPLLEAVHIPFFAQHLTDDREFVADNILEEAVDAMLAELLRIDAAMQALRGLAAAAQVPTGKSTPCKSTPCKSTRSVWDPAPPAKRERATRLVGVEGAERALMWDLAVVGGLTLGLRRACVSAFTSRPSRPRR